jgi:hypothetical protein
MIRGLRFANPRARQRSLTETGHCLHELIGGPKLAPGAAPIGGDAIDYPISG